MLNNILNLDGVAVLDKKQQSNILGGEPSERRCDRLLRRAERYLDRAEDWVNDDDNSFEQSIAGYDRVMETYNRIC